MDDADFKIDRFFSSVADQCGLYQDPLSQATCEPMMVLDDGHHFCPAEAAAMVQSCFDGLDGLRRASCG